MRTHKAYPNVRLFSTEGLASPEWTGEHPKPSDKRQFLIVELIWLTWKIYAATTLKKTGNINDSGKEDFLSKLILNPLNQ